MIRLESDVDDSPARASLPAAVGTDASAWTPSALQGVSRAGACEVCGQDARVHVLAGYAAGQPIQHRYCLQCADATRAERLEPKGKPARRCAAAVLGLLGLGLGIAGICGDAVLPAAQAGFGWYQRTGVAVGALVLFLGAVLGADLVMVAGALLFGSALCADWVGLARWPGIGWKQSVLLVLSMACLGMMILGLIVRRLEGRSNRLRRLATPNGGASPRRADAPATPRTGD